MISLLSSKSESRSTNQKIFFAAMTVGIVGMLPKVGIALKDLIVAKMFGRGDALDAFLIAFLLPSFIINLAIGSLCVAFIPVFIETREKQGAKAAQRLFSSTLVMVIAALTLLAVALWLVSPYYLPLVGSNFSPEKLLLTRRLLCWMLPFIVFNGVATFISGVLNAGEGFALPAVVPLVTPVLTIVLLESMGRTLGIFSLVAGVVAGSIIEAITLIRALKSQNLSAMLRWHGVDEKMSKVLSQYAPAFAGSFLMGSTTVVDQAMAGMLPAGSVAALSYANKFVSLILAVCAAALSTATLPYFSKMVANRDWAGCRHTLKRYSGLVLAAAVPVTVGIVALSEPLVRILFQRGTFTAVDTALVSRVQVCYAFQIPFYICGMLFVRFVSSMKRNDVLMYGATINVILNVVLNFLFIRVWGLPGIALSTACVYLVSFLFLGAYSIKLISEALRSSPAIEEHANGMVEATDLTH